MENRKHSFFRYLLLIVFSIFFIVPFGYAIYTSLLSKADIGHLVIPTKWTFENYKDVFVNSDLLIWYKNSIIVTLGILIGNLIVNTMAAYSLARLNYKGRGVVFFLIIGMMMVPYQVMIIPIFSMIVDLKWMNSYYGLIIPFLFQGFLVFLMRQFFLTIPKELEEAAEVDGLNKISIFFRIMLPLSKGALGTQIIFSFTGTWNSFVWPVTLVNDSRWYVLTVGLNTLKNRYFEWPNLTMTGVVLLTVPIIIVFLIFQRQMEQGIATTGLKG
ncbi:MULTISPECIES: carbohydrate ABC transporter permease [Paenibacillus]|uniref:Sugar ABC transporter permease n=1 Tax=Paenibacillus azoreducens TaxID=116718 RepID=A0A919YCW9_9BACL|nr:MULTISPECIES: carbohydrate ABC transporter permease [Paenibacillus]MBE9914709.1 carbohydrate ABC transporter permease [Paenibacillus donghaensis]GIO46730.1 sugar ABC transporter permease [Paenibacillus azoreducens]